MRTAPPPAGYTSGLNFRLLGPLEVHRDGASCPPGARKQRAVLTLLALQVDVPVATSELIDDVWGPAAPASAPKMLQLYVCRLRGILGADTIRTTGRGYQLVAPAEAVDVRQFEQLVGDAARAPVPAAGVLARRALALWHSTPFADLAEDLAAEHGRHLDDLRLRAHEICNEAALAAGEHAVVLMDIDALIRAHPARERLHAQRMLALYRDGRQAEAADGYRRARHLLSTRYGMEPGRELRSLQTAILRQDQTLDRVGPSRNPLLYEVSA